MATVDGKQVNRGDWIGFKSDIEQSGRVTGFGRSTMGQLVIYLENPEGFSGEYIGGETETSMLASDCWID